MKLSEQGINLIKGFEGLRLSAYRDVAGVWTIGYGSTRYHDGKPVKPGDKLAVRTAGGCLVQQYARAIRRRRKSIRKGPADTIAI